MPNITQKMMTQQLRELEADGVINRIVYNQVPPKVEYTLTPLGRTLISLVDGIRVRGFIVDEVRRRLRQLFCESVAALDQLFSKALKLFLAKGHRRGKT